MSKLLNLIGEKKQQQPDQFIFAENASHQMNALLVNNEHEIAEINRKELISSRMLDKSIDHDLPDDLEELVLDVPKVSNEIF